MSKTTTFPVSAVFISKTPASKALHRVVGISLLLIIFSIFSSYTIAGIQEKPDLSKMVQSSDLVIRGKVISTESQWKEDSRGRHIHTSVTVEILDKIKGNIKDGVFAFEVIGGTVDDIREFVSDTPAFEIDEDAIVFLGGEPLTVRGGTKGKVLVYDGRVRWEGSEVTVDSFIQALKILEQDPGATIPLWEESESPAGGVTAAECFIYDGIKWLESSPVVYYKINENTSDCTGEGAAVQSGAATWGNACDTVDFRFQYDGSCSSTSSSMNGINEVMWGTTGGSLATNYYWYYPSTGEMIEFDIVFNDGYNWSTSPSYSEFDVESVGLHEFGHGLHLADLYDSADSDNVMYWSIMGGEEKRELSACDIDGLCYIYYCGGDCGGGGGGRLCSECEPEDENLGTIGTTVWGYSKSGNCGNEGKWVGQFTGEAGATYHFDLCPDNPGSGSNSGFDSDPDIKITNGSCSILDGEDGDCSSPSYSPNDYQWVCSSSGTYYVIIAPYDSYDSHTCIGDSGDTFTLKYYKEGGTCPPPTGVSASDGTYTDKVQITWNSVSSPCSYYRVYRATSSGGTKTALGSSCQISTTYDDTDAIPGMTYYYWVKSAQDSSCSDASDFSSYNTGWRKLSPPTGVSIDCDTFCIEWDSVSGANYYRVYRATSPTGTKTALGSWQTSLSYCDSVACPPGTTYYYWVQAATSSIGYRPSDYSTYVSCNCPTPLEAQDGSVTTSVDTPVTITLQATDDGYPDPLTYIIMSLPVYGDLNDPCAGLITDPCTPLVGYGNEVEYIPDIGYEGQDSFTFIANDGGEDSNEATVSVNITACIFFDDFPSTILDTNNWDETFGTPVVDGLAVNEPSPPYSLHLEGTDGVTSRIIDLYECWSAKLHYWWKHVDTESGDDLYVDYWDGNEWQALDTLFGDANTDWEPNSVELPAEALHSEFQLRFRAVCDSDSDEWYIDDACIQCRSCIEHPVLETEPNATSGLCNRIYWAPAAGANDYYAECANDMNFTNIDGNSGWITDTSYEFCGLEHGQTYWYRVNAWAPFLLKSWQQTSQVDFETDTLTDTIATADGNVVLAGGAGTPTVDTVGGSSLNTSTSSSYLNCFLITTETILTQIEVYIGISTSQSIEFVVYEGGASFSDTFNRIHSSTLASSGTGTKFYNSGSISVPLEAGKHYMIGALWSSSVVMYYDSGHSSPIFGSHVGYGYYTGFPSPSTITNTSSLGYTFYHRYTTVPSAGYDSPGSIVSAAIDLPADGNWGAVDFNTTTPLDTELTVDVLNGSDESNILADVSSGTDISLVTATVLKLRANLSATDANNTPVLHDWSVGYTDPAFACESDWSNEESSMQCITIGNFEPDCDVDWADLAVLVDQWLQPPGTPSADIAPLPDGDGIVNMLDFAVQADNWLEGLD